MFDHFTKLAILTLALGYAGTSAAEYLKIPGGEFIIAWETEFQKDEQDKIRAWLTRAAGTTSLMNGQFPRKQTQIYVSRYGSSRGPVPWAHTVRDTSPQGVKFSVNPNVSLGRFNDDWTAVHEFSHLYIPYPGRNDIWISEGFATYYQTILMSRAGILTERAAWQKFADGFARGAKNRHADMTLAELSPKMRRKRAFMRVYWSGTLYFLEADILLRNKGGSLDAIVTEFVNCCRNQHSRWNGRKLARSFDRIAGTELFESMFREYEGEYQLRDYSRVLARVGIQLDDGKVEFVSDNDLKLFREKFTRIRKDQLAERYDQGNSSY